MITEFNKYDNEINKYWLVATDERFVPSLRYLGCNNDFISYQSKNDNVFKNKYVYIGVGNRGGIGLGNRNWSWASYNEYGKNSFEDYWYKYMGTINIEDYELNADKYNL